VIGLKYPRPYVCIDVDIDYKAQWCSQLLSLEKAILQYSWIPRRIKRTRHGIHVYLPFRVDELGFSGMYVVRVMFGDDLCRLHMDEVKHQIGFLVNRCYTSTEMYEVDPWSLLE